MSDNILTLRNIETYYGPILAIKGISLDVQKGKIVTILGANGAGKTTILKTISGAMDPQKGKVEFLGKEIQKQNPDWVARKGIAHVPEGREVFPLLSVQENLLMGRNIQAACVFILEIWRLHMLKVNMVIWSNFLHQKLNGGFLSLSIHPIFPARPRPILSNKNGS